MWVTNKVYAVSTVTLLLSPVRASQDWKLGELFILFYSTCILHLWNIGGLELFQSSHAGLKFKVSMKRELNNETRKWKVKDMQSCLLSPRSVGNTRVVWKYSANCSVSGGSWEGAHQKYRLQVMPLRDDQSQQVSNWNFKVSKAACSKFSLPQWSISSSRSSWAPAVTPCSWQSTPWWATSSAL